MNQYSLNTLMDSIQNVRVKLGASDLFVQSGTELNGSWMLDIKGFDNIPHKLIRLNTLAEKIKDKNFLKLIEQWLKAGYDNWKYHRSYSGTPQGGIISPLLANIYSTNRDRFVEQNLIPHTSGTKRRANPDKEQAGSIRFINYVKESRRYGN
ncbi:reverse transcriptase domain-containing protein [Escherichia coli]|uniref:reverse transcriptase domain-containing protein n=1 Tax=Escherichia coli TaxID=562 RepID=UPI00207A632D|nr:reverse transcriptase domain-containing protein [Escherichia coli]